MEQYQPSSKPTAYFTDSLNGYSRLFAFAGWVALHFAAAYGSLTIAQLIFDRIQVPDLLTADGVTPLCFACSYNSRDVGKPKVLEHLLYERPA